MRRRLQSGRAQKLGAFDRIGRHLGVAIAAALPLAAAIAVSPQAGATPVVDGTLTGTAVIRGAPAGFTGEVGVAACPASSTEGLCSEPLFALSGSGGSYTISLAPGTWMVREFYSIGFDSGAFIGRSRTISISSGQVVRQNVSIRYQTPSAVSGTMAVEDVPPEVSIEELSVIACPSTAPEVGGEPSVLCATDFPPQGSSTYSIPTLSKGIWDLYIGYYTEFGLTTVPVPGEVKLAKGESVVDDLTVDYQTPTNAIVEGTVTVTGAPDGFEAVAGVGSCPASSTPSGENRMRLIPCPNPAYTLAEPNGSYSLLVPEGPAELAAFYELAAFGGQFLSAVRKVTLTGGSIVTLDFTIPYQAPATVGSTIRVTGVPSGTTIEDTILLACPSLVPYTGSEVPIECVFGFAPPPQPVSIDTLPPGKWLLYPGYETAVSETIGTTPTAVHMKSGQSRVRKLTIAYQD